MYAMTCTRPDIAFVRGKLSRYTSNHGTQHWQVIQRVLEYLKKTMDYRLMYTGYPSLLEGYTDARWISNIEDNSSTSGWEVDIIKKTENQAKMTKLSMEWKRLCKINAKVRVNTKESAVKPEPELKNTIECNLNPSDGPGKPNTYSQMYNGNARHLGVRYSMIRELITNGVVSIEFVRSQQNLTDHLMKGLARDLVIKSAEGMGLKSN
ncbi:hypothetical protein Tco_1548501 [Tanacetum coccineum]